LYSLVFWKKKVTIIGACLWAFLRNAPERKKMIAQKRSSVSNLYSPSQLDFIRQFAGVPVRTAEPSVLYTQQDVRVLADSMLKEAGFSVASVARADRLTKEAAARWKTELLKRGLPLLRRLAGRMGKLDVSESALLAPRGSLLEGTVAPVGYKPVYRDGLLRMIRGDHKTLTGAVQTAAERQTARGTVGHKVLGPPVNVMEVPYDQGRSAFRGINGGTYGTNRMEWLGKKKLYHNAEKNLRAYYSSRPEYAAAYAKEGLNTPYLSPGQRFMGEFDLSQVNPLLSHDHAEVRKMFPLLRRSGLPAVPGAKGQIPRSLNDIRGGVAPGSLWLRQPIRNLAETSVPNSRRSFLERLAEQRRRVLAGAVPDLFEYQTLGSGQAVPYRKLYRVSPSPDGTASLPVTGGTNAALKERLREASEWRNRGYMTDPDALVTPIELTENMTDAMRRSASFFQRYGGPKIPDTVKAVTGLR
jgi:hypothetical protein